MAATIFDYNPSLLLPTAFDIFDASLPLPFANMQISAMPMLTAPQQTMQTQMAHMAAFHTGAAGDVSLPTMSPTLVTPLVPLFNRRLSSSSNVSRLMSPPASGIMPVLQDGIMFSDVQFNFSPTISSTTANTMLIPPVSPVAVTFTRHRRNAILVNQPVAPRSPRVKEVMIEEMSPSQSPFSSNRRSRMENSRSPGPYEYPRIISRVYTHEVTDILNSWLEMHRDNPYPSAEDKRHLMHTTGLTKMQLKNWFCNVRRRKMSGAIKRSRSTKKSTQ
ncbi:hypothetical protein FBU59_001583 [Linderina macrospora]|uniref:Uncharacterized protein n=1 Tax=Linderina macrospora TaxID=4868 RepID=A0ACC1JDI7_9FUNG|nr:hypothetical protein FBU59_001583 [Linderina macrospora]